MARCTVIPNSAETLGSEKRTFTVSPALNSSVVAPPQAAVMVNDRVLASFTVHKKPVCFWLNSSCVTALLTIRSTSLLTATSSMLVSTFWGQGVLSLTRQSMTVKVIWEPRLTRSRLVLSYNRSAPAKSTQRR